VFLPKFIKELCRKKIGRIVRLNTLLGVLNRDSMKPVDKLNKLRFESFCKRINFKHCVIPVVKEAVEDGTDIYEEYGAIKPYIHIISEEWLEHRESTENEIWSDSIAIKFGRRPLPVRPVVPHKSRSKILSEDQVSMVISQSVAGDVVALIYPPKSDLLSSNKECYVFERWSNPADITTNSIKKLIKFSLEVNNFTQTLVFPNPRGIKATIKLQAKDEVLANGGSRIWVWVIYIVKFIRGVAKMYGMATPNK
jgi:hypothetical protein